MEVTLDQTIISVIHKVTANKFIDTVNENSKLLDDGILNSLDMVNVMAQLEREHGVRVPPKYVTKENFETISSISAVIRKLKEA